MQVLHVLKPAFFNSAAVRLASWEGLFWHLWTNLTTQAVTRFKWVKLENWLGSIKGVGCVVTFKAISSDFSADSSDWASGWSGQDSGDCRSHWGPFHHSWWLTSSDGYKPLEAQSAGLSADLTCLHLSGGIRSIIVDTRFPTYVLNLRGLPSSQLSTMVLSVQATILERGILSTCLTWFINWASTNAPHNSSLGIVSFLIGATLVLAMTSVVCTPMESSEIRR